MSDLVMLPFPRLGEVERWLPVVGFEDSYEVSSLGQVRSLDRIATRANRWGGLSALHLRGRTLRQQWDTAGYLQVCLYRNAKGTRRSVHQLVAQAFIGPCPDGREVRHGPNGRLDNRAAALCYGTRAQQFEDMVRDGTQRQGVAVSSSKLTASVVAECRLRRAAGETVPALAGEFSVSVAVMGRATNGQGWHSVPAVPQLDIGARADGAGRICFPGCACGRHNRPARCVNGHELTEANTYVRPPTEAKPSPCRECKTCRRERRNKRAA